MVDLKANNRFSLIILPANGNYSLRILINFNDNPTSG